MPSGWSALDLDRQLQADTASARLNRGNADVRRLVPRFDDETTPRGPERASTAAQPKASTETVARAGGQTPPPDREVFRSLVLTLLPDRLPGTGGLPPEGRLQGEIVARCHRGIRREGWAMLPFMVPNGVLIPRRGRTPEERARDPLPAIIGARLKAQGLIPGIGDLGFLLWPPALAFMEVKRPRDGQVGLSLVKGSLRVRAPRKGVTAANQRTFAELCRLAGWPCPTVETLAHAEAELLGWGVAS